MKTSAIHNAKVKVQIVLAEKMLTIKELSEIKVGSTIMMDRLPGESIDLVASGEIIGKGEVVVIDESFGLRITELLDKE
jgi:flagellar motor switch protein FliN/FliY